MSESLQETPQTAQTDFRAEELNGRPSGADATADDRPKNEKEAALPDGPYADIQLPPNLRGQEEAFAEFKKLATSLQLSGEAVKQLVQWEAQTADGGRRRAQDGRTQILERWKKETRDMFGPAYERELARALGAVQRFGGEELRALLDATGLGNHPVLVKTFHEISKQIGEDQSVSGQIRASADKTFSEALYGKAQ